MAQSLAKIYIHVIFRTKNQDALIEDDVRDELHRHMAGILQKWESFQDEYRRFLKAYNIEFDERYVWD